MTISIKQHYCAYCGRIQHRCTCSQSDSDLRAFLILGGKSYTPFLREIPYKRGVPPQIKKRERATIRSNYKAWYAQLCAEQGEHCANCGATENLAIDHVLSIAKGGLSEYANLQLLCATCNRIKGKLVIDCRL